MATPESIRAEIERLVRQYYQATHAAKKIVPGRDRISYAGRVFDEEEMVELMRSSLDFWLTLGPYGDRFEKELSRMLDVTYAILVNSGSSANLVALTSLISKELENPLREGDEVITPAVTFPTTLAPLVQHGLHPVFLDCEMGTYNIDVSRIEEAISPRTRCLILPHTLGNVYDLDRVMEIVEKHRLFLIEDACDALGGRWKGKAVGSFGHFSTVSFYPAHHITMGEGGAVMTNGSKLSKVARSVRDWGRDCWCEPGVSNTCKKRFGWQLGDLPFGYDHKYTYTNIGYNLKPTDLQAAVGLAQLKKLPDFVSRRRKNFDRLYGHIQPLESRFILPRWDPRAEVSWFGFPLTVRPDAGFTRNEIIQHLEEAKIETRLVFAGNILRQPAYRDIPHRIVGSLENSDRVMTHTFFLGVYPGMTDDMLRYMADTVHAFVKKRG